MIRYLFILAITFSACYSFKGVSIPADVNTYFVENVEIDYKSVPNSPIELPIIISESLKQKVQDESRLVLKENDPDVTFRVTIKKYRIESVAPEEGSTTALNRLEVALKVEYESNLNEEDNWSKSFADFEDFPANQSLLDVEEDLIDVIMEDIMDRIFNEAFTNW